MAAAQPPTAPQGLPDSPPAHLPNPLLGATPFSSALLHYGLSFVSRLMARGGTLTEVDLWAPLPTETAGYLGDTISAAWEAELAARPSAPRLWRAFAAVFGWRYAAHGSVLLIKSVFFLSMAQALFYLLSAMRDGAPQPIIFGCAAAFVAAAIAQAMLHHCFFWLAWRDGMQWRTAGLALIFRKSLRLRLDALAAVSSGGLISLASNDLERTTKLCQMGAYLVVGPIEASVVLWLLWRLVGVGALAGYATMAALVLWQGHFSRRFGALREVTARLGDARCKAIGQVVVGARVLKAFGWEAPFLAAVRGVRAEEMRAVRAASLLRAVNEGCYAMAPAVMGAATFLTARYAEGRPLGAPEVFVALTLLNFLQIEVCAFFPRALESWAETRVALDRVQALLLRPEALGAPVLEGGGEHSQWAVRAEGADLAWAGGGRGGGRRCAPPRAARPHPCAAGGRGRLHHGRRGRGQVHAAAGAAGGGGVRLWGGAAGRARPRAVCAPGALATQRHGAGQHHPGAPL